MTRSMHGVAPRVARWGGHPLKASGTGAVGVQSEAGAMVGDGALGMNQGRSGGSGVVIPVDEGELRGMLEFPEDAPGVVLFAHGAGSSRFSPRNRQVARVLQDAGIGTLLFDLLMESEAERRENVFDIGLLASRLILATFWVRENEATRHMPIGYFGASTGAAAALVAAARMPTVVDAIVSRGGRPDLAGRDLAEVCAPTLLIVGGRDEVVLELNREALERLRAEKELVVIPGATHLFEEPGALDQVAELAADWFRRHLGKMQRTRRAA
ncbi:MAG TPA: dienelactone hydrolase family protein [Longimicrobiales bacterium]